MDTREDKGVSAPRTVDNGDKVKPAEERTVPRAGGTRLTGAIIGKRILKLARQHPAWSYQRIAERVCKDVPGATTSSKSVASVIAAARRNGEDVPERQRPH